MVGIGLFAPLPLAVMIPFMAGQSFAMGEAFGKGFQFGKRKISSMSNEEFNALTGPEAFAETTADIKAMIPTMSSAMQSFHTLQSDIIKQMIDYIAQLPADVFPSAIDAISDVGANVTWPILFESILKIFGSNREALEFLESHGLTASAQTTQSTVTNQHWLELQAIARLNQGTTDENIFPENQLTQQQILEKYPTFVEYRSNGGLLTSVKWEAARQLLINEPTEAQENPTLPLDFIASLDLDDFKIGGDRTRQTSFGLLTWSVPFQFTLNSAGDFVIRQWVSGAWKFISTQKSSETAAVAIVNQYRVTHNAQFVKEFRPSTTFFWYLLI